MSQDLKKLTVASGAGGMNSSPMMQNSMNQNKQSNPNQNPGQNMGSVNVNQNVNLNQGLNIGDMNQNLNHNLLIEPLNVSMDANLQQNLNRQVNVINQDQTNQLPLTGQMLDQNIQIVINRPAENVNNDLIVRNMAQQRVRVQDPAADNDALSLAFNSINRFGGQLYPYKNDPNLKNLYSSLVFAKNRLQGAPNGNNAGGNPGGGQGNEQAQPHNITRSELRRMIGNIYEEAQRYTLTSRFWITPSGYMKKDICQDIMKWAGQDKLNRWQGQLVNRRKSMGTTEDSESNQENQTKADLIADRYENGPKDKSLPEDVRRGIHEIDKWILDNTKLDMRNEGREEFQVYIMKLSDRERLYLYYLVQERRRKAPDDIDTFISQKTFVPDVNEFARIITATAAKIWRGGKKSRIDWDKLEDACVQLRTLNKAGALEPYKQMTNAAMVEEQRENQQENHQRQQEQRDNQGVQEERNNEQQIRQPNQQEIEARRAALNDVLLSLRELREAQELLEKENKKKAGSRAAKSAQAKVNDLSTKVTDKWEMLVRSNQAFDQDRQFVDNSQQRYTANRTIKQQKAIQTGSSREKVSGAAADMALANKVITRANQVDKTPQLHWDWVDSMSEFFKYSKLTTVGVSTVLNLTNAIIGLVNLTSSFSTMTKMERTSSVLSIISGVGSITKGSIEAYGTFEGLRAGASLADLTKGVSTTLSNVGVGLAALSTGISIYEMASYVRRDSKLDSAREQINQKYSNIQGPMSRQERLDRNMVKLAERVQSSKAVKVMVNATSTCLGSLSIAVPILALGVMGMFVVGLTASYIKKKKSISDTVEEYLKPEYEAEYQKRFGNLIVPADKNLAARRKDAIYRSIYAGMGFTTKTAFFAEIKREMAKNLYNKLFYKDEECTQKITQADYDSDPQIRAQVSPYRDLAKSLGIKPKYPADANGDGAPGVRGIFNKFVV